MGSSENNAVSRSKNLAKKIRQHALEMTSEGKSSHIGSIFSMADILAVLYEDTMNYDSSNPNWHLRDRFILSKGHAGAGVYAVLAEKGFFSTDLLKNHYKNGSIFSGHVSHKGIPGVEFSTGSLGHGLGVAVGMSLAAKKDRLKHRVYTLISDGECDEGSNWEAIMFASHHKLDNLIAIVDYNKLQSIKSPKETLNLEPFSEKWKSFGWEVVEIDGHNHHEIISALGSGSQSKKPKCVIAHTTKGKGVSFMENSVLWHYRSAQGAEFDMAMKELRDEK